MLTDLNQNLGHLGPAPYCPEQIIEIARFRLIGIEVVTDGAAIVVALKELFETDERTGRCRVVYVTVSIDAFLQPVQWFSIAVCLADLSMSDDCDLSLAATVSSGFRYRESSRHAPAFAGRGRCIST